ncbi:26S proteasome non-ATPase regulatory subunit 9 isoform X2 [Vitis riparia]|uniref:uncharacterized protein LOC100258659 isoform X3 n=1 Tax=Vitis vinifera TaxID=29760 RepID=UPI00023B2E5E|nr:uncharacterized protein LOC100258659 isoform X3 [Vitis vinifera]XP_034699627.1 26S proteasome non-ATPase regulatory subunit 9 isoform X2 [Vitis riparia]|eukprot:XP_003633172.1 PREDICTED: 26S proteasome non-ATPase regulatory subunit 9 isoform X2 [Vitis vinifera]
MVGANLKAEAMALMDRRTELEAQMNAIIQRLCQPGGPGISGSLVDSEGFPRSDIDIPTVRAERQRLAELRNDYKDITEKINENIQLLHSARLAPRSSLHKDLASHNVLPRDTLTAMDVDATVSLPFAVVDEIAEASPAAEDGLQLGDRIVKFGNVEAGDNLLPRLASEAQTNHGHAIPVIVMRQGALINLTMTPRTWQGRGLLGCHFQML